MGASSSDKTSGIANMATLDIEGPSMSIVNSRYSFGSLALAETSLASFMFWISDGPRTSRCLSYGIYDA